MGDASSASDIWITRLTLNGGAALRPPFVMIVRAFHGTTASRAAAISSAGFKDISKRPRWLGPGHYFYQDAPASAARWARYLAGVRGEKIAVIEVEIDLSEAMDLLDIRHWDNIKRIISSATAPPRLQMGPASLFKLLSDAEQAELYNNHEDDHYFSVAQRAFAANSVRISAIRAAFIEGFPIHPRSWLFDLSHLQICVKDPSIIKIIGRPEVATKVN